LPQYHAHIDKPAVKNPAEIRAAEFRPFRCAVSRGKYKMRLPLCKVAGKKRKGSQASNYVMKMRAVVLFFSWLMAVTRPDPKN